MVKEAVHTHERASVCVHGNSLDIVLRPSDIYNDKQRIGNFDEAHHDWREDISVVISLPFIHCIFEP